MRALRDRIERLAATDFTVLIEGESGTGKELVARQIHDLSPRRAGPFVAINCAALVESLLEAELFGIEERTATGVRGRRGKFEHADTGTLFLDEVSDLSLSAQAKLLRAIQELAVERVGGQGAQRVDIRIVAATNRSLRSLVADGAFRADLFYRLGGVELQVPPLRHRQADIVELSQYFLERHRETRRLTLSPEVVDGLLTHDWPGNVRELQRVIESVICVARGERAELSDLPPALARRCGDRALAVPETRRHAARVGQPLRATGVAAARPEQTPGVRHAGHQLSHAAIPPALRQSHVVGERAPVGVGSAAGAGRLRRGRHDAVPQTGRARCRRELADVTQVVSHREVARLPPAVFGPVVGDIWRESGV